MTFIKILKKISFSLNYVIRKFREWLLLRQVAAHKNEIYIGGPTKLSSNTFLGKNPNFNGLTINGLGKVTIGDNFHSGTDCLLITSIHNYDSGSAIPYDSTHILKNIFISDNVWLGDRVTIIGAVSIGEGAIVQAGAVVVKDVPPFAIVGGNPAQIFKYRNIEHYIDLKNKNMFH